MAAALKGNGILDIPEIVVPGSVDPPATGNIAIFWNNGLKAKLANGSIVSAAADGTVSLDLRVRSSAGSVDVLGVSDMVFPESYLAQNDSDTVTITFPTIPDAVDPLTVRTIDGVTIISDVNTIRVTNGKLTNPSAGIVELDLSGDAGGSSSEPYQPRNRVFGDDITFTSNQWDIYMGPAATNPGLHTVDTTAGTVYILDENLQQYPNFDSISPDLINIHGDGFYDNGYTSPTSGLRFISSAYGVATETHVYDFSQTSSYINSNELLISYIDDSSSQTQTNLLLLDGPNGHIYSLGKHIFENDPGVDPFIPIEFSSLATDSYIQMINDSGDEWIMGIEETTWTGNFVIDNDKTLVQTRPMFMLDDQGGGTYQMRQYLYEIQWGPREATTDINWNWAGTTEEVNVDIPLNINRVTFFGGTMRTSQFSGTNSFPGTTTVPATYNSDAQDLLQWCVDAILYYNLGTT